MQSAILLFVLIFNSTFSVLVAAYNTDQAQSYTKIDAVLICTGTSFKWMSKSTFIEKGIVQYIEEPEDIPSQYHQVKCSYSYLIDHHTTEPSVNNHLQISEVKYNALVLTIAKQPYTSFTYSTAHSRAPPYNI
ncbi:hypothetical protein ACPUVO_09160 [Pseudocolwellia sp. HL-MZ19]|uniref:hypothetical protein n=1 Tax=Pseudocolwellia sp. HL-MZ19 TaxID=3400846 RepID=UPI003CF14A78